jgi:hypothetical protein
MSTRNRDTYRQTTRDAIRALARPVSLVHPLPPMNLKGV